MSRVKAGEAFVEIGGDPRKLFATLGRINRQIGSMGAAFSSAGRQMMAVGAGLAAPFGIAAAAGSRFQDVILAVKASTGATAAELEQVKAAAMAMSQSLGVGPTEAAQGFLELLKAGMGLEQVLGGAGKAAIQFAKVGGMAVADAAVVMSDAMNVFKVGAATAANTISAAADASSTSIELLSQSFTQVSAVAGLANQSIQDTAAALAVLANAGVKGSDAGTSLKTMLMRLMAPAEDAVGALQQLGLSTQSFRNADGTMKPMVEIIRTLSTALDGMDQAAKDDIFRRIFGQDAIRAAAVLTAAGVEGFQAMQDGMGGAMTVGDKFATMMSGLSGAVSTLRAAMERLAISVGDAVGPALMGMAQSIGPVIDGITKFVSANKELVVQVFKGIGMFTAAGAGMLVFGGTLSLVSGTLGKLASIASAALAPLRLMMAIATGIGGAFASAVPGVFRLANSFGQAIVAGVAFAGSAATAAASYVSSLAVMAGATASRMGFVAATWAATGIAIAAGFLAHFKAMITYYTGALAGMQAITIARTGAMAAAWLASLGGVDTFGNALKATLSMSNRVVATTVATIGPALGFISKGFMALASDVARLAAPLTQPFVRAAGAVATFAAGVATSVAAYISSIAAAASATVANNARIASAWVGSALKAVSTFVGGVAGSVATYVGTLAASVAATVGAAAGIAGAWLATAFPATAAFVSQAVAQLGVYIASVAASLAASVRSAAGIAVAWVSSGMPGLAAFVGSAVAGIATYLGSCAVAVAGSVASAAAVAAAWLAPVAPILAVGAVIAGIAVVAYKFSGQIKNAFAGLGRMFGSVSAIIGETFSTAFRNAKIVFGDLFKIGKEAFGGIYDAIANGDLAGAMQILTAGLQAIWTRSIEALLHTWHSAVGEIKKAFVTIGSAWDAYVTKPISMFGVRVAEAAQERAVLGSFDTTQGTIFDNESKKQARARRKVAEDVLGSQSVEDFQKNKARAQAEIAARQAIVDAGNAPGATEEQKKAAAEAVKEIEAFREAINLVRARFAQLGMQTAEERQAEVDRKRAEIDAATQQNQASIDFGARAAGERLSGLTRGQRENRVFREQADEAIGRLGSAATMDEVRQISEEFHLLAETGRLTAEQQKKYADAVEAAGERIETARGEAGVSGAAPVDPEAVRNAAAAAAASQSEVAGTFSAQAINGMGFGQSLAQKQLDELRGIRRAVEQDDAPRAAA